MFPPVDRILRNTYMALNIDMDKVDHAGLALLSLGRHDGNRSRKSFDWEVMGRFHQKGYISDAVGDSVLPVDGLKQSPQW